MTVLDASALLAYLRGEQAGLPVEDLLRRRPPPSISAVNLSEVIERLIRLEGRDPGEVNDAIDLLIVGGLEVEPFWLPNSRRVAAVRARYYHRTRSALSLADCAAIATAIALETGIATTDQPLAAAARDLGVEVIELPSR
jgi:PIN domain nuclease of toxin-antitoxin system